MYSPDKRWQKLSATSSAVAGCRLSGEIQGKISKQLLFISSTVLRWSQFSIRAGWQQPGALGKCRTLKTIRVPQMETQGDVGELGWTHIGCHKGNELAMSVLSQPGNTEFSTDLSSLFTHLLLWVFYMAVSQKPKLRCSNPNRITSPNKVPADREDLLQKCNHISFTRTLISST